MGFQEVINNIILYLLLQKKVGITYCEAECIRIDAQNKKVYCRSNGNNNLNGKEEFAVDFDYLVIATGARSNTFNIPGVEENTIFLKVRSTCDLLSIIQYLNFNKKCGLRYIVSVLHNWS